MECKFCFTNISNNQTSIPFREKLKEIAINPSLFDTNINNYNLTHFINAVKGVCKINNWNNDEIEITCCCSKYYYNGKQLYTIYDLERSLIARRFKKCDDECELCSQYVYYQMQ